MGHLSTGSRRVSRLPRASREDEWCPRGLPPAGRPEARSLRRMAARVAAQECARRRGCYEAAAAIVDRMRRGRRDTSTGVSGHRADGPSRSGPAARTAGPRASHTRGGLSLAGPAPQAVVVGRAPDATRACEQARETSCSDLSRCGRWITVPKAGVCHPARRVHGVVGWSAWRCLADRRPEPGRRLEPRIPPGRFGSRSKSIRR